MKLLLLVLAFVGLALASKEKDEKHYVKEEKHRPFYGKQFSFHGRYHDKCGKDGFYYQNDESFVICSNNNAYVQPCAPGSRNSPFEKFNYGTTYYYRDFCDVNLVDHGYGVNHYDKKAPHYPEPKHEVFYGQQYKFHGKYYGQCANDGFYYKNDESFVICSNNNAYVQPCAPGSRNSAFEKYHQGSAYYYRDFCDINLVDHGYGVKHGYHNKGYENNKVHGYDEPQYGEYKTFERREQYGGYNGHDRYGYGGRPDYYGYARRAFYGEAPHDYRK